MSFAKRRGRVIGILLLIQMAAALIAPFILIRPINAVAHGFLAAAAENSAQIRAGVLIALVGAGLTVAIGILAGHLFLKSSEALALGFLMSCVISCVLDAVHYASVLSVLSFSQDYSQLGGADPAMYRALGEAVASARWSAHIVQLLAIGVWIFLFYLSLLRFHLIPRFLAVLGLLGILLQFTGVTLMLILGQPGIGYMAMPMAPIHLTVAIWLMVKGFKEGT